MADQTIPTSGKPWSTSNKGRWHKTTFDGPWRDGPGHGFEVAQICVARDTFHGWVNDRSGVSHRIELRTLEDAKDWVERLCSVLVPWAIMIDGTLIRGESRTLDEARATIESLEAATTDRSVVW